MIQRRVFVSGRVQGVGFRAFTLKRAAKFTGLRGFVRNLPDGRVEALFAGANSAVSAMVEWCRKGPLLASVTDIEIKEEPFDEKLSVFSLKY
ncbi:MAG: hypothetical protein A3K03_01315 [Bdellovibrionales bacterium RIFOXYD1_FULL_44_7]|nr:MAG: hypothetical protein A3K03_01315 [Bdellovibrionales bacterium RIFOXYD1_FULL_44_7]